MNRAILLATLATVALPLSGCLGFGGEGFDFEPGSDKETGRTVHLKATVVDLAGTELYPGLKANLWAFCFAAVDPNDLYSVNSIQKFTPLAGDVTPAGHEPGSCSVPGPTIRVQQGDRVKVEFSHSHFHPHTIHWHGQFVPWDMDGAPGVSHDSIPSGGSITYDFIAKRAGTLWYHCHVDTQFHVMNGLYGAFIVEPASDKYEPKGVDRDYVMVLSTMNRNAVEAVPGSGLHSHPPGCASGFQGCENPPSTAGQPDVFLLNGHSYPLTMDQKESLFVLKEGERIRIRIINAGETAEEIHPHGHDMLVTHLDGNPLPPSARYYVDTIRVGPAERVDVVIDGNNPGPWMIHTHIASHETNCGKSPGGMHTMLVYEEFLDRMHQFKAELPASCPFGSQLQLPGDFVNTTSVPIPANVPPPPQPLPPLPPLPPATSSFAATWSWPLELSCGVRKMEFRADISSSTAGSPLTNLQGIVKDPAGAQVFDFTLNTATPSATYLLEKEALKDISPIAGAYTVEVTGGAVQGDLRFFVHLDYYETFEQSKTAHLLYKVGGCPGFT